MDVTASALSHRIRRLEERLGRSPSQPHQPLGPCRRPPGFALAEKIAAGLDIIDFWPQPALQGLSRTTAMDLGAQRRQGTMRRRCSSARSCPSSPSAFPISRRKSRSTTISSTSPPRASTPASAIPALSRGHDRCSAVAGAEMGRGGVRWIYLARKARRGGSDDLSNHKCIRIRTGRGQIYKWEFERGEDQRQIDVRGHFRICGDTALSISAALDGLGLYYCLEKLALPYVAEGRLEIVLGEWASFGPGYACVLFEPPSGAARHPRADRGDPRSSAARLSALRLVLGRRGKRRGRVKHEEHPRLLQSGSEARRPVAGFVTPPPAC